MALRLLFGWFRFAVIFTPIGEKRVLLPKLTSVADGCPRQDTHIAQGDLNVTCSCA